jgi:O-antigen/teichoic acid export membrane protein
VTTRTSATPAEEARPQLEAAEIRSRATRGVFSVGMRNVLVRLLGFLGTVGLTRLLTPHQFGLLAFGFAVKSLSDVIASGGLAAGMIRRPEPPTKHDLRVAQGAQLSTTIAFTTLIGVLGLTLGGVSAIAAIMALSLPIYAIRVPTMVLFERNLSWSLPARIEVTETLAYNIAAVGLVALGGGVIGAAFAVPIQACTGTLLLLWKGPIGLVRPRFLYREAWPMIKFGTQFQSVTLVSSLRDQGLNMVLGATAGISTVGIWTLAYRVLQPIGLVLQSLWRVSYPASARILEAGEDPDHLTERALRLTSVVVGVPVVLMAGTAPDLIPTVFGARWSSAAAALPWGAAAFMVIGPVSTFPIGFLQARGDVRRVLGIVLTQAVVWMAGAAILSGPLGAQGVGIAMFAGSLSLAGCISWAMKRHSNAQTFLPILPAASAALAAAGTAWLVAKGLQPPLLGLVASTAVALAGYGLGLMVVRRSDALRVARMVAEVLPLHRVVRSRPFAVGS